MVNPARTILGNMGMVGLVAMLEHGLSLAIAVAIARLMGVGAAGDHAFIVATLFIFGFVANPRIDSILVRELCQRPADEPQILAQGFALKLALSLTAFCGATLYGLATARELVPLVLAAATYLILPFWIPAVAFQARLMAGYPALLTGAQALVAGLAVLVVIVQGGSLAMVFGADLAVKALCVFTLVPLVRAFGFGTFKPRFDRRGLLDLLGQAAPQMLALGLAVVYSRFDQVYLYYAVGGASLAYYAAAVRLAELPVGFALLLLNSSFPLFSARAQADPQGFERAYRKAFRYVSVFLVPVAVVMTFCGERLLELSFGPAFATAARTLALLSWGTVIAGVWLVYNRILIAARAQMADLACGLVMAALNVGLNVAWVSRPDGAALASLVSYPAGILFGLLVPRTRTYARAALGSLVRPLVAALPMAGILSRWGPHPGALALGAGAYLVVLVLVGGLGVNDLKQLQRDGR